MDKVTVIVPVYRVEAYLERCVRSLTGQTYDDLEIILVDDGSPDRSGAICEELALRDDRIRVIHQPNAGVSAARNRGLDAMTGDWVCFCDGDDWYEPEFVEKLLACARNEQADFVVCNYQIAAEGRAPLASGSLDGLKEGCDRAAVIALGPTSSCTHMFRRSLFEKTGVRYPEGCRQSEELPVVPVLAKYAEKIGILRQPLYNYFQRGDGTSASNRAVDSELHFRRSWQEMGDRLGGEYRREAEYHAIYALLYGEILNLCKQGAASETVRQKIEAFEREFPEYRENPYWKEMGRAKTLFLELAHRRWITGLRLLSWIHSKIVN